MSRSSLMGGAAALCLAGTSAFAQVAQEPGGLEEVVVTAQRRAEDLQTVPIALTALSAQALASQGITDTQKLELVTPGLVFSTFNGAGQPYRARHWGGPALRRRRLPVALYVDGVYRPGVYSLNQDFFDVERVEVLKGPQGTLYGRNTTGGAINILTRDPAAGFRGAALASYATHETVRTGLYLDGGSARVAGNLSGYFSGHEGYQRNLFDGSRMNDKQTLSLRGKVKVGLDADQNWTAVFAGDLLRDHGRSGSAFTYLSPNALPAALGAEITTDPDEVSVDFRKAARDIDDKGLSATIRGPMGGLDFVSISAYRETQQVSGVDYDNSPIFIAHVNADQRAHSYSQEFQLLSPTDGALQWVLGAYGFFGRAESVPLVITTPSPDPTASQTEIFGASDTRALAAFAQGTYAFDNDVSVTAGLRYNVDRKELIASHIRLPDAGVEIPFPLEESEWDEFTPKLSVQYAPPGTLLYASVSRGFKSGNYNITSPVLRRSNPRR